MRLSEPRIQVDEESMAATMKMMMMMIKMEGTVNEEEAEGR